MRTGRARSAFRLAVELAAHLRGASEEPGRRGDRPGGHSGRPAFSATARRVTAVHFSDPILLTTPAADHVEWRLSPRASYAACVGPGARRAAVTGGRNSLWHP